MGSRLRENPSKFIECWCEIVAPQGPNHPPWIIQKFPRTYEEGEVLKAFLSLLIHVILKSRKGSTVQHFSFVLTNVESKFLYGFCRHAPESETAIVILSHLPWHELFYKILNHCSTLVSSKTCGDLWSFLQCLYQTPVPAPGTKLSLSYGENEIFVAECPNHITLPSIPENRNLSEYFSAVDIDNMMTIFASMLNERRIIVTSERIPRLSACVQAANSLIYPMSWQHIFIPVLPEHLLDYLNAPMPYLIGVASLLMKKVRVEELGEVVILNADTNLVNTPFSDLHNLPDEVVTSLRKSLSPPNNLIGDGVARAFLRALVHLIGNYREALQFREEDKRITFNQEKFVSLRPLQFQPFVLKMLELQIFTQFIEERLDLLNSGLHTSDEFELEASVYSERSSSKMKQLLSNVRKESGAIMKNVRSKTNPAMKSAVKSVTKSSKNVRERSKITYKELRGRLRDAQQKSTDSSHFSNGFKPRSAPSSPTNSMKRPLKSVSGVYEGYSVRATYKRASQPNNALYSANKVSSSQNRKVISANVSHSSSDSQKTPSPQEIDLLGEMEDVLKTTLVPNSTISLQENLNNSCISSSGLGTEFDGIIQPSDAFTSKDICKNSLDNREERSEGSKSGASQDLLLLDSPKEEEFDPLLAKDIPPSIPYRQQKLPIKAETFDYSSFSQPNVSSIKRINDIPGKLKPDRFLPFTSLNDAVVRPPSVVQNPFYSIHTVPLHKEKESTAPDLANSLTATPANKNNNNNPAAVFAASLIATGNEGKSLGNGVTNSSTNPFKNRDVTKEQDLLGDFSADFSKLTVTSKGISTGT